MAYTNETTHYGIPLPLGSDLTTPMDYNPSAQEVDTVLFEAKTDSASSLQKANQLQQDLATTNGNVTAVTGRVTTLEGTVTTQGQSILQNTQDISDVRADALDMIVAKDEGTAQVATVAVAEGEYFRYNDVLYIATQAIAVGDTIVPNTNCKATNVGTELNQLNNDLSGLEKHTPVTVLNPTVGTNITSHIVATRCNNLLAITGYFQVTGSITNGMLFNFGNLNIPVTQGGFLIGTAGTSGSYSYSFKKISDGTVISTGDTLPNGYYSIGGILMVKD